MQHFFFYITKEGANRPITPNSQRKHVKQPSTAQEVFPRLTAMKRRQHKALKDPERAPLQPHHCHHLMGLHRLQTGLTSVKRPQHKVLKDPKRAPLQPRHCQHL